MDNYRTYQLYDFLLLWLTVSTKGQTCEVNYITNLCVWCSLRVKVCRIHWFYPIGGCPVDGVGFVIVCNVYSVSWLHTSVQMSHSACGVLQVFFTKTWFLVSNMVPLIYTAGKEIRMVYSQLMVYLSTLCHHRLGSSYSTMLDKNKYYAWQQRTGFPLMCLCWLCRFVFTVPGQ